MNEINLILKKVLKLKISTFQKLLCMSFVSLVIFTYIQKTTR